MSTKNKKMLPNDDKKRISNLLSLQKDQTPLWKFQARSRNIDLQSIQCQSSCFSWIAYSQSPWLHKRVCRRQRRSCDNSPRSGAAVAPTAFSGLCLHKYIWDKWKWQPNCMCNPLLSSTELPAWWNRRYCQCKRFRSDWKVAERCSIWCAVSLERFPA